MCVVNNVLISFFYLQKRSNRDWLILAHHYVVFSYQVSVLSSYLPLEGAGGGIS